MPDDLGASGRVAVPDAVAPPPRHPRFPLLDGMRALAVLCIVVVHVAGLATVGTVPLPDLLVHLDVGVTIFFLISGFLLYRPFIAHRTGGPSRPETIRYARRRVLRIVPAYWLALTLLTVIPGTTGVSDGHWLSQYTFTYTLPLGDGAGTCVTNLFCGLAQTWSLAVEVMFYAALPLWFLVSERLARGRSLRRWVTTELVLLTAIAVLSILLKISDVRGARSIAGGTVAGYLLWFGLGMALAIFSVALHDRRPPRWLELLSRYPVVPWALAATLYAALCAYLPSTSFLSARSDRLLEHVGFAAIALLLMLPAVFGDGGRDWIRRGLENRFFAWLGLISYGIFLWHLAVIVHFSNFSRMDFWPLIALALACTVPIAAVSYYALERPLLRLK